MTPYELAEKLYAMMKKQEEELYLGDSNLLSSVIVDGNIDLIKIAAEIIALGAIKQSNEK